MTSSTDSHRSSSSTDLLPTGVEGLDRVLRGGLRRGGVHVLLGRVGTGKSILAHQMGARHIREDGGSVLYLTALVESHQTLLAQARAFAFFDASRVARDFYYASLFPALEQGGLDGMWAEIRRFVQERIPTLLIIDGLHALQLTAASKLEYQRFLHELESLASNAGITVLLLTHPRPHALADPTFTTADGVLVLRSRTVMLRSVRQLSVLKMRGIGHITGWHSYLIAHDGIHLYPRLEALVACEGLPPTVPDGKPFQVAFDGFERFTGGGLAVSSTTLVPGTPGSGKTMFGLAFLTQGAEEREPGLFVGFHETPDRLIAKAEGVGLRLGRAVKSGLVELYWRPPSELLADEIASLIFENVARRGVKRLVIDSIDDVRRATSPGHRMLPFLSAFVDIIRARGVGTVLTQDLPRIAGASFDLPIAEVSPIMDNMIHFRMVEVHAELRRLVAVIKMRDQGFDGSVREFHITSKGLRVGERFQEGEALLTGLPHFRDPDRRA